MAKTYELEEPQVGRKMGPPKVRWHGQQKGSPKKDAKRSLLEVRCPQKDQSLFRDPLGRAGGTGRYWLEEGRRRSKDLPPTPIPKP